MMVTAMKTRKNTENQKQENQMGEFVLTGFYKLLDREFNIEKYYGR